MAEKEKLLIEKSIILRKTKERQEQIANDEAARELLKNRDLAEFRKDSIKRANKLLIAEKRREKAEKARIDALEKKVKRAEIDLKLNNERISKEKKEELLKQKSKLDNEIASLNKIQNDAAKKSKREKQKGRRSNENISKAKAYEDSMQIVLKKRSERDWELYRQREKELKAKIKLQREKLKTKKAIVREIGEKKRELTESDKLKAAKARVEEQRLEQEKY